MNQRLRVLAIVLLLAGGLFVGTGIAQEVTPAESGLSDSQQQARSLLLGMARYLQGVESFEVRLRVGYDVVQSDGLKIEFGELRDLSVERPRRLLSRHVDSSGRRDLLLFDGEVITVSDAAANVYAQAPQPGDIDASVKYFVRDLQMRLPLAPLLLSRFSNELERRVRAFNYIEQTEIWGASAHHIVGRTDVVDFQIWILAGDQPLPVRLVLTYREEEGQPQFRAEFSDWNLDPSFAADHFRFAPATDAKRIVFAAAIVDAAAAAESPEEVK